MNSPALSTSEPPTYQVSELAEILRSLLEDSLPSVWVQGEISNFSRPASGHWYFTLKDGNAQLRCAMFKNRNFNIRPQPRDGDTVRLRANVSFYTGRGDLQLICDAMEAAGEGALLAALERLKKKLAAEGLFDPNRKRPLPALPHHIGVITSATGAAIQDVRATLARRFPLAKVSLFPVPVQGAEAAPAIVKALQQLPSLCAAQVILLVRGGGSLEDLMAFNDERVVRAVAACALPVVSGVGHEVDFTLVDFAADYRAPTPTAAAEAATPSAAELLSQINGQAQIIKGQAASLYLGKQALFQGLTRRLHSQNPARRLQEQAQRLDDFSLRLAQAAPQLLLRAKATLPPLNARLRSAMLNRLQAQAARLAQSRASLIALSPTAVLARGYAIALTESGQAVHDAGQLILGERLQLRFAKGAANAVVTDTHQTPKSGSA